MSITPSVARCDTQTENTRQPASDEGYGDPPCADQLADSLFGISAA
jgi:hypothetical protein